MKRHLEKARFVHAYFYASACRRISSSIEFFGSDLTTILEKSKWFKYQKLLSVIVPLISFCMFYFVEVWKKEEEIKEGKHMTFSFYYWWITCDKFSKQACIVCLCGQQWCKQCLQKDAGLRVKTKLDVWGYL